MSEEVLETSGAARILGVTPAYVRLLHKSGRLKAAITTASGQRLFERRTVERLRDQRAVRAASNGAV